MDLENLVTPVNVRVYEKLLNESKYDPAEIDFLVNGFLHGFSLGYEGK